MKTPNSNAWVEWGVYRALRKLGVSTMTIQDTFNSSLARSEFVKAHQIVFWGEWVNLRWYRDASVTDKLRIGRVHSLNQFARRFK